MQSMNKTNLLKNEYISTWSADKKMDPMFSALCYYEGADDQLIAWKMMLAIQVPFSTQIVCVH